MASLGLQVNKELIGNLIILLADKCAPLYHTKLIKMLYLIDEQAIKDSGVPITWLDFKVWQYGPVDPAIFFIKKNFESYIALKDEINSYGKHSTIILPRKEFSDEEFSEYELEIVNKVITEFKDKTTSQLVDITHKAGSLWDITRKEHNLVFSSIANISDVSIDMSRLVKDDPQKYSNYMEAAERMSFLSVLHSK